MTNYIQGIDGCSIQASTPIKWDKVYEAGIRFMYWKATQYSGTVDRTFWENIQRAEDAGLVCGAYHFCAQNKPGTVNTVKGPDTPELQMQFFYDQCQGYGSKPGQLPPMLDWEYCTHQDNGQSSGTGSAWCVEWLERAAAEATRLWYPQSRICPPARGQGDRTMAEGRLPEPNGRLPVIYTYPYYGAQHKSELIKKPHLGLYPLCYASYKAKWDNENQKSILLPWDPEEEQVKFLHAIPPPWTEQSAVLHQYSGNNGRRVPGIVGDVDRQVFYGIAGEFARFIGFQNWSGSGEPEPPIVHPDIDLPKKED